MRNGLMMKMRKVMKQFTKYICAFLMLVGINASAWGVTITLKVWDHAKNAYVDYGTFESGNKPGEEPMLYDGVYTYYSVIAWAPGEQIEDIVHPNNSGSDYYGNYAWPNANYSGAATELYAVYYCTSSYAHDGSNYYTTKPNIPWYEDCTDPEVTIDPEEKECNYGTLTNFTIDVVSYSSGTITWSSTNTDVATVSGDGEGATVTIVGAGMADIVCSQAADGDYCAGEETCALLVNAIAPTLSHNASGKELTVTGITSTGATFSGGVVTSKGGLDITRYGFTIGTSSTVVIGGTGANAPVASGFWDEDITLNTAFGSKTSVSNFSPNTTYYVRAFAYNGSVYGYSTAVQFKTLKQFTISLDGNGGSDGIAAVEENAAELIEITAPTRDHYTLEGYYTTSACETKIANTAGELVASITVGGNNWTDGDGKWIRNTDETFYANWTPDNQTISFNNNGGSGSMDNVVRAYNTTYNLPACTFTAPDGKVFDGWAEGSAEGTVRAVGYSHTVTGNITFYAKWRDGSYTDAKFSCADWSLTGPSGDIVFITSAANKTVRSQEAFHVSGSGLPHSTALTFSIFPASSKFVIKKADGTIPSTDEYGVVNADVYVFYTPGEGDTSDGLDEFTSLTVSVTGEPRTATIDTKRVIGRHLPADFVIAGKKDNKWYALPADFSDETTPDPVEIAVDDINNPTIAYTANTNIYNLYGQNTGNSGFLYNDGDSDGNPDGEKIKLGMKNNSNKPLFAYASPKNSLKGDGLATVTNNINKQYWWTLKQINTSITNPQDAKYNLISSNNPGTLSIKNSPFAWGTYATGVEELRLIPASSIPFTEAEVVEWGRYKAIVEVNAQGISATKVKAILNDDESAKETLSQTLTSVKSGATKYDYTVDFKEAIDFAAAESNGAMMTLEWYNSSDVLVAISNVVVPKIIATSATMSSLMATDAPWSTAEVHVLPGVTLEANAGDFSSKDVVINQLEIYPGATVKVTKGAQDVGTLKVKTLVLRNGWTRVGEKAYDVARLYVPTDANLAKSAGSDVWYSDWYIDYDQYYPIAVPFPVATSSIVYKNTSSAASAGVKLRYYSGELRAAHIQENQTDNWVEYTWGGTMPTNLEPSHGYIMTARRPTGKAFSIVRMPMTFSNEWTTAGEKGSIEVAEVTTHKDQVGVTAWGDENTPSYAKGWNIIANPFMALHQGALSYTDASGDVIEFANIPDINFKEYDQLPIDATKLKPSSAFLVQAPKDGTVTFGATNRQASAPSYRQEIQAETYLRQKAYIVLANDEAEDMMGIWISEKYSAEYEINADLEKLLGDGTSLKTYMQYGDRNMAYVAINEVLAREWIPVTVRIPESGEYTYSLHEASIAGELEGIYLIDYTNGQVTNLIDESYSFAAEAGTINGRFAINAIVGQRETPTGIDAINAGGDIHSNEPVKFIWNDKVFILHRSVIYDSTGKRVREINR